MSYIVVNDLRGDIVYYGPYDTLEDADRVAVEMRKADVVAPGFSRRVAVKVLARPKADR